MATGKQFTYKVHEVDASTLVLDSVTFKDFSHEVGFTTTTSVVKEDFPVSAFDAFTVKLAYPAGSIPANSTTLTAMLQACSLAIRTAYGQSEVVSL
jgi:hypothetical protein